jgi:hypothetical protein
MFDTSLAQAVERFALVTHDVPDAELDREWAWGAYDSDRKDVGRYRSLAQRSQAPLAPDLRRAGGGRRGDDRRRAGRRGAQA